MAKCKKLTSQPFKGLSNFESAMYESLLVAIAGLHFDSITLLVRTGSGCRTGLTRPRSCVRLATMSSSLPAHPTRLPSTFMLQITEQRQRKDSGFYTKVLYMYDFGPNPK